MSKRPHTRVLLSTKARFEKQPTTRRVFWSARNEYHLDHPHDTLPFVPLLFGCPSRLRSREIEEEEEKRVAHRVVVWIKRLVESREKSFCRGVSSSQTMAPPPPRSDRGDREVPTSTKNTTSKTSSDEGSNDRRAEKRYEERGLVFGVVTSPWSRADDG